MQNKILLMYMFALYRFLTEVGKITILQLREEADLQDVKLSSAEADWVAVETADGLEGVSADDQRTRESAVGQRMGRESADDLDVSRLSADGQEMGDKSAIVAVCEVESTTTPQSLAELETATLVNLEHALAMNLDQELGNMDLDLPLELEQAPLDPDFKLASVHDLTEIRGCPALDKRPEEVAFNTGIYMRTALFLDLFVRGTC
jgi:hypothetical protein